MGTHEMKMLNEEGKREVGDIAMRHGVSSDAVMTLLRALADGRGIQAQFSHPDLGGMGQWSQGGMIMVGDMFNHGLKARVDTLCNELSALVQKGDLYASPTPAQAQFQSQSGGSHGTSFVVSGGFSGNWWPENLGAPSSVGAQNEIRYAYFPAPHRLAIQVHGRTTVYDTGDHQIGGFSQQQGGDQSLTFTSQHGLVRVADLPVIRMEGEAPNAGSGLAPHPAAAKPQPVPGMAEGAASSPSGETDVFATLERLARLKEKGVLSQDEFDRKKSELLSRI
jgi:hypothetical protein